MLNIKNAIKAGFTALLFVLLLTGYLATGNKIDNSSKYNTSISDLQVKDADGKMVPLSKYKGKVLMIVNVASKCGNTPQYQGLQKIYEKYNDRGFEILAFPCNDFGNQEPGTNEEIYEFCTVNYGVTFKLFDKVKVLGPNKSPLYARLINNDVTKKGDIEWNFEKFLIGKNGEVIARFHNKTEPTNSKIIAAIEKELRKKE